MIKIITIVGARPQFIKASALSRAIASNFNNQIQEIIIHTGQHYDHNMSDIFFEELSITPPQYKLNVGSGLHGQQTGEMLKLIENVLLEEKPNFVVLYGDTNSTLAGALAASKLHIPIAHVEAGLRSFNKAMPEEINRILTDHVSTLLFSPTLTGYQNLAAEGFKTDNHAPFNANNPKVYHCGDVMYDNSLHFAKLAAEKTTILTDLKLVNKPFILATVHRNNNTDEPQRLSSIFEAFNKIAKKGNQIIIPLHPRTAKILEQNIGSELFKEINAEKNIRIIASLSFLEMTLLEANAEMIITDSGGVQKESYFFKKPCIVLRSETEWVELLINGNCMLADSNGEKIIEAFEYLSQNSTNNYPTIFGDGNAANFILEKIIENINSQDSA